MAERPIVVGVDGTNTAYRAVAWAAEEALLRRRPLRLVHAAPYLGTPDDPDGRGRADAVLARARAVARQIAPDLTPDVATTTNCASPMLCISACAARSCAVVAISCANTSCATTACVGRVFRRT